MPTPTTDEKRTETSSTLDRLERMVRWSDAFTLGFVKCNHPAQREELRRELLDRLKDKHILEIRLEEPVVSLLDEIKARWDDENSSDAVFVYGLEKSINVEKEASSVMGRLNHDRDLLRRSIPAALLIWLPDFAMDCLVRGAPDFWAWRSGVYEFGTDHLLWQRESISILSYHIQDVFSYSVEEKKKEISHLHELIRSARELPRRNKRSQSMLANLLFKLGTIYQTMGEYDECIKIYDENLIIYRRMKDNFGISNVLIHLADIHKDRDNLNEAEFLVNQALEIRLKLNNMQAIATALNAMATIQQGKNENKEAEKLYEKALEITKEINDSIGVATILHNLALLQEEQGLLSEAEQLYEQSLAIGKELGDKEIVSGNLQGLASIHEHRGNFDDSLQFFSSSLNILQEIGDKIGNLIVLKRIAYLLELKGDFKKAFIHYLKSYRISKNIGPPYEDQGLITMMIFRDRIGNDQFQLIIDGISKSDIT